jgi:hypothetical protein
MKYNQHDQSIHRAIRTEKNNTNDNEHDHRSNYPSYSSNAMLYTSIDKFDLQEKQRQQRRRRRHRQQQQQNSANIDQCSRHDRQSTSKLSSNDRHQQSIKDTLSSSMPLSITMLDKLIYTHEDGPISTLKILPQQAHTLHLVQSNHVDSLMSIDSLIDDYRYSCTNVSIPIEENNRNELVDRHDTCHPSNRIDLATQWSLQLSTSKYN